MRRGSFCIIIVVLRRLIMVAVGEEGDGGAGPA